MTSDDSVQNSTPSSRRRFLLGAGSVGVSAFAGCGASDVSTSGDERDSTTSSAGSNQQSNNVLNILTWEGYGGDAIVKEFEQKHDVTVNIKLVSSDPEAFNILKSGGVDKFDILTLNNTWAQRHAQAGTIEPLTPDDFPAMAKFLKAFQWPFESFTYDEQMYALPTRWGWDTMAINSKEVAREHVTSYDVLWTGGPNGKYKDRIGMIDWPTWQIPKTALALGYPPFEQTEKQLEDIKQKLIQMFSNMKAVYTGTSAIQQAFLQEDIVMSPIGNFTMSQLRAKGHDWVDVVIPDAGGLTWIEGICMVKDPQDPDLVVDFMKEVVTPKGQFSLSWKPAAKSPPVNTASFDLFSKEQQSALMFNEAGFEAADTTIEQTTPYKFSEMTGTWTDLWTEAKARAGI